MIAIVLSTQIASCRGQAKQDRMLDNQEKINAFIVEQAGRPK